MTGTQDRTAAERPIALLGACGALAPADVLARMQRFAAERYGLTQLPDHPPVSLLTVRGPGLGHLSRDDKDPAAGLRLGARQLDSLGPSVFGVASCSAYAFLTDLAETVGAELVNLVEAVAAAAEARQRRYLLLMCREVPVTLLEALDRRGVSTVQLGESTRHELDEVLRVAATHEVRSAGERLVRVLARRGDTDYDAILVGCCELAVVIADARHLDHVSVLNCNQVLAEALVEHYFRLEERPALDVLNDNLVVL